VLGAYYLKFFKLIEHRSYYRRVGMTENKRTPGQRIVHIRVPIDVLDARACRGLKVQRRSTLSPHEAADAPRQVPLSGFQ
jgi:hypothetical protein